MCFWWHEICVTAGLMCLTGDVKFVWPLAWRVPLMTWALCERRLMYVTDDVRSVWLDLMCVTDDVKCVIVGLMCCWWHGICVAAGLMCYWSRGIAGLMSVTDDMRSVWQQARCVLLITWYLSDCRLAVNDDVRCVIAELTCYWWSVICVIAALTTDDVRSVWPWAYLCYRSREICVMT